MHIVTLFDNQTTIFYGLEWVFWPFLNLYNDGELFNHVVSISLQITCFISSEMSESATDICFVPFNSVVDTSFWHMLSKKKLEDFRLEEGPFSMFGQFTNGTPLGVSPRISFDYASMNE